MKDSLRAVWRWVKWPLIVLAVLYAIDVAWAVWYRSNEAQTNAAVAAIHAQKITLADVMGTNLPPVPDQAENDATVAGIDKNNNNIRDDVELAIFKKYPNSAKIRAAELQYAMTEQMYLTKVTNTETWRAVAQDSDRAYDCIAESFPVGDKYDNFAALRSREKEVENLVFNTEVRKEQKSRAYDFTAGYGTLQEKSCDIDLKKLPN